jgi:hypothetical protein
MTDEEFDNASFNSNDKITIRKYLFRETENIKWVDFTERIINGYKIEDIIKHESQRID